MSEKKKQPVTRDYGKWKAMLVRKRDGLWQELHNSSGYQPTHPDRDSCRSWAKAVVEGSNGQRPQEGQEIEEGDIVRLIRVKEDLVFRAPDPPAPRLVPRRS